MSTLSIRIGVISDTHGLLRPQAKAFLTGSDHIIHAGDVGHPDVLAQLSSLAPLTAVRGNNDRGSWAASLPRQELIQIGELFIYVLHDIMDLDIDPVAAGVHVIISGHSHKPAVTVRSGVYYLNPGSAGPRRFKLPIAVAELQVAGTGIAHRIVELQPDPKA